MRFVQIWFQGTNDHNRKRYPWNKGHILIILQSVFEVVQKDKLKLIFNAPTPSVCNTSV